MMAIAFLFVRVLGDCFKSFPRSESSGAPAPARELLSLAAHVLGVRLRLARAQRRREAIGVKMALEAQRVIDVAAIDE